MPRAGNKWSTFDITAKGTHMRVLMDGRQTVVLDDGTYHRGPIALQWGGGIVSGAACEIRLL